MKKSIFMRNVIISISFLALIATGMTASALLNKNNYYDLIKSITPISITIVAGWLGYCFQRRNSYLQNLRELWKGQVLSAQQAYAYLKLNENDATKDDYQKVIIALSCSIDELRGTFKNKHEGKTVIHKNKRHINSTGYYPYESLKNMYKVIERVGYGENYRNSDRDTAILILDREWKSHRSSILKEYDRPTPDKPSIINDDHSNFISELGKIRCLTKF